MASICSQCKEIFERPLNSRWHTHHPTHDSFKQAVAAGCYMCKALASEIRTYGETVLDLEASAHTTYAVVDIFLLGQFTVVLHWQEDNKKVHEREFSIRRLETVQGALATVDDEPTAPSRLHLDTAKRWIRECQDHHSTCRSLQAWRTKTDRYVPKRLVAIGEGDAQHWRLVTRDQCDETARDYATLSHRWSSGHTVKLLVEHLETFTTPQPTSDLPATFRDAITVALELGLKYIWIDCLCIIQDSDHEEDWKDQGTEMCNIYTNAVVNISATGVPNNTHSFLKTYEGSTVPLPPIIQHKWHNDNQRLEKGDNNTTSSTPDEAAEEADKWCVVDPYFWWSEVTNTVLLSRGWVFQERYLAPRVLHFGANQLLWECTTMDACEAYPRGLPDYVKSGGHTDIKRIKLDETQLAGTDLGSSVQTLSQASLHVWCDLVQAYTRTHLTKHSDKLIAFSGVAELVRKLYHQEAEVDTRPSNDGYAAGIFTQHLLLMLEWHTKSTLTPTSRPAEYRAPTWSWASIDGRVCYEFLPHVIANPSGLPWPPIWAQVLRSSRYPATLPATGRDQQQGASEFPLVLDVELGAATTNIDEHPPEARPVPRLSIKLRGHILPLQSVVRVASTRERGRPQPIVVEEDVQGEIFLHDNTRRGNKPPITKGMINRPCLPLRCLELMGADSHPKHWVTGLILQPHPDRESVYSRCGFFAVLSTEGVERIGIRVSGESGLFRADFAEDMEISSIEII